MPLVSTAIKGLDEEIGGGIPPASIVLLSGTPGTYKSSMAFGILHDAALKKGEVGLYVLLEQSMGSLLSQQEKMGRNMDETARKKIIVTDVGRIRAAMDKFSTGNDWMQALRSYVEYIVEKRSASYLVIDSLPVLEILSKDKNRREFLFDLFEWIHSLGTTTFLIQEKPSLEGEYGEEEFLSDGVFQLTLSPVGEVDLQRRIRCIKMRGMEHNTSMFALELKNGRFRIAPAI
ncbi:MAG: ATPase domain-containing protein [Thermoplasmatota archaeon]